MRELILECVADPDDVLTVEAGDACIEMLMRRDGEHISVYLDKAKARELFNWLGVYLHT